MAKNKRPKGAPWSEEDKQRIVAEYLAIEPQQGKAGKGKGRSAYLKAKGISTGTFHRWTEQMKSMEKKTEETPAVPQTPAPKVMRANGFAVTHGYTREQRAEMYRAYMAADQDGKVELLKKWDVPRATIASWSPELGRKMPSIWAARKAYARIPPEERKRMAQEFLDTPVKDRGQTAKRLGVKGAALRKWAKIAGIDDKRPSRLEAATRAPSPVNGHVEPTRRRGKPPGGGQVDLSEETQAIKDAMLKIAMKTGAMKEAMAQVMGSMFDKEK